MLEDKKLEDTLWRDPLAVAKKILDKACNAQPSPWYDYPTQHLFIGEWDQEILLGDNENIFSCNKIISFTFAHAGRREMWSIFGHNATIKHEMLKCLDYGSISPKKRDEMLREFFCSGHDIKVCKSRWISTDDCQAMENCKSLVDACRKCGLSPEELAIEIDLKGTTV